MIKNLHDEKIENEYYEWLKNEKEKAFQQVYMNNRHLT